MTKKKSLVDKTIDFGENAPTPNSKKPLKRIDFLGGLHEKITRGLPDLCDETDTLDVKKLAEHLGISFQAVYKFFKNDQIPAKRIVMIITLSKQQTTGGPNFRPLVRDDFWEFLSK